MGMREIGILSTTMVYASINYISRSRLGDFMIHKQVVFSCPWNFMGDFNTILGTHIHGGHHRPARVPMEDFRCWSDHNYLIHLSTMGMKFTRSNRMSGLTFTLKRFDVVMCNIGWLDMWNNYVFSTLVNTCSNHLPHVSNDGNGNPNDMSDLLANLRRK